MGSGERRLRARQEVHEFTKRLCARYSDPADSELEAIRMGARFLDCLVDLSAYRGWTLQATYDEGTHGDATFVVQVVPK